MSQTFQQVAKLVQEGQSATEVHVESTYTEKAWSPYLSLADALKLDDVRIALPQRDLELASRLARVFKLVPIAA